MPTAWRIVKRAHLHLAFSGEGAKRTGGRWNSPGLAMIYTSEHKSLAVLEVLVHLDVLDMAHYLTFQIEFDRSLVETLDDADLPRGWRAEMPAQSACRIGDAWIQQARSAILAVPSAIVPEEINLLLNPAHPAFKRIRVGKPTPFTFDPRLIA